MPPLCDGLPLARVLEPLRRTPALQAETQASLMHLACYSEFAWACECETKRDMTLVCKFKPFGNGSPRIHTWVHIWERLEMCRVNPQLNACFADEDFVRVMCSIASCLQRYVSLLFLLIILNYGNFGFVGLSRGLGMPSQDCRLNGPPEVPGCGSLPVDGRAKRVRRAQNSKSTAL